MKKVLSFVLVLAMILGSVSMVFATPVTAIKQTAKLDETNTAAPFADAKDNFVATILRDLGVVDGDGNGNANLADGLTRAEAAALIVKAMGLGDQGAVQTTTKFADVKKADWFSGYVAVAAANGFVDGDNGKFNPNGKLTMDEAITLVLKSLGYDAKHLVGTWPANYRDLALTKEILDVVVKAKKEGNNTTLEVEVETGSQAATRGDLFNLFFNCLYTNQKTVTWVQSATELAGEFKDTGLLNLVQKITRKTNNFWSLGYTFVETDSFVAGEKECASKFDASEFNGQKVYKVVKTVTEGNATTLCVVPYTNTKTVQGKFAVKGNIATFTAIDGTVYTGLAASGSTAVICENGGYITTTACTTTLDGKVDTTTVYTLRLVCGTKNPEKNATVVAMTYEKVNYVLQANATDVALFANANLYRMKTPSIKGENVGANDAFNDYLACTDAGVKKNWVLDDKYPLVVEGAATKLSEIQANDIVEMYLTKAGDGKTYASKLVVTRNVVTGALTSVNTKAKTYTVNGTAYKFGTVIQKADKETKGSGLVLTPATIDMGTVANAIKGASEYAFYLDSNGKVAYAKLTAVKAKTSYKYAFVLEAGTTAGSILGANNAIIPMTNMHITLLPLDTMEVVEFNYVSSGALKANNSAYVSSTDYTWAANFTTDTDYTLVKYYAVDGVLKGITEAAMGTTAGSKDYYRPATQTDVKFATNKVTFKNNETATTEWFKTDVKIYTVKLETGMTYASAAAYKLADAATMNKATATDISYKYAADDSEYVDVVIAKNPSKTAAAAKYVTVAAITNTEEGVDGTLVTFIQPGSAEETLYTTGSSFDTDPSVAVGTHNFYKFTLTDGRISKIEAAQANNTAVTPAVISKAAIDADLVYTGYRLQNTASGDNAVSKKLNTVVKFMFFDNSALAKTLSNIDDITEINDTIAMADSLYVYSFDNYDVVVVVDATPGK